MHEPLDVRRGVTLHDVVEKELRRDLLAVELAKQIHP
jgi:hypothetical protein